MLEGLRAQRATGAVLRRTGAVQVSAAGAIDRELTVLGLPLFPAALFVLWAVLIAAPALILEGQDD